MTDAIQSSRLLKVPERLLDIKIPLKVNQVEKVSCSAKEEKIVLCKVLISLEVSGEKSEGISGLISIFTDGKYQGVHQIKFLKASSGWLILDE